MKNIDSWKLRREYVLPEDKETVKDVEGRMVNASKNGTKLWSQKEECTFHNGRKMDFGPSHHEEMVNM